MNKYFYLAFLIIFFSSNVKAQNGINFQGVARNANNVVLASQNISVRLSLLQGNVFGNVEYQETKIVTTNAQGLFNIIIGDGTASNTIGNYSTIVWKDLPKFLKLEIDPAGGSNFLTIGTTQLQFVAYAHFANGVAAENIVGLVPVARGGTGSNTLLDLKNNLQLNNVNNTADSLKPISKAVQVALDDKLSITGNAATATSATTATTATTAGTATTATRLTNARNINGVPFDGSADITITSTADAGTLTGTSLNSNITGSSLTSVGTLANLTVTNPIVGNITGNAATATSATTATTATTAGTATTATRLTNARNINGVPFDGSADITITSKADAGTLTGTSLNSNITGSSLTSVGTLANLTVTNPIVGNITGNAATATSATTATTATTAGTATTATRLTTARNINGVPFDGSTDIIVMPPRMTRGERDNINFPAIGSIIFCTDCSQNGDPEFFNGTRWTSMNAAQMSNTTIGDQIWSNTNLNVTRYRNGDIIPQITDLNEWLTTTEGAWCWYNNDSATYAATYGKLYNFFAVSDFRGLAPLGWHVATDEEWAKLSNYLGGGLIAGKSLKQSGTSLWSNNIGSNNSSGFSALPGGRRTSQGFSSIGVYGIFWSSYEDEFTSSGNATSRWLYNNINDLYRDTFDLSINGYSVRCVRD